MAERNFTYSGAEGSFGTGTLRKHWHRCSRIVPVNGHEEYDRGGTAIFALCAEKSVQRAFLFLRICIVYREPLIFIVERRTE